MAPRRLSLPALAVVLGAACAAWVSAGTLTVADASPGAPRLALLPPLGWLALLLFTALAAVLIGRPRVRQVAVLALAWLVFLPWLPFGVPSAALAWTGHLRLWLWVGIAVALVAPAAGRLVPAAIRRMGSDPRRAPWLAAAIAACACLAGARQVFPHLPAGDEPHYLVITQSLLNDHDLKIENNHRQGDYRVYYRHPLKPDFLRRGRDGEIYSIHAPGLAALVAPVFALGGYPAVLAALALLGGCATALAWLAAWRVTRDAAASWFGWAAVALSVPFFYQSFVVLPDGLGAAIVMASVLAMLAGRDLSRGRLCATGVALAILPWLHTRFALLAAALSALILARNLGASDFGRRVAALLAVPLVSAAAWFGFFYIIYGTPNPTAPYGGQTQTGIGNLPRGVIGLLFDQQFGLIPNAPVYLCAGIGLIAMARRTPRLLIELLFVIVPYGLSVAAYQMWWAGYSSAARFLVPVVLPLAIPAAVWFAAAGRGARIVGLGALLLSVLITGALAGVERGALLYNMRQTAAAEWLVWISPLVNLATGVPSLFQTGPRLVLTHATIWALAVAATAWVGVRLGRRPASAQMVALGVGIAAACTGMAALSLVWRSNRAAPVTPTTGSIEVLHHYDPRDVAVRFNPLRLVAAVDLPPSLVLAANHEPFDADGPLLLLNRPPAATYEIELELAAADAGQLTITVDREFGPQWSANLRDVREGWRQAVTLPVGSGGLAVGGDLATRRALASISIRAIHVPGPRERLSDLEPMHAVRYGPAVVFLLDGHAYTEPGGTWIGGGDDARFAIEPDPGAAIRLFVRNAPVQNEVTLESGGWRQVLALRPREERMVDVPVEAGRPGSNAALLRVTTTAGFRPADLDPSNTDRRLLGCWIETR
jgi:hypothetical protein